MDKKEFNELIDTSKQGIDHCLSQILLKGYKVMFMLDSEGIVRLKYTDSKGNISTLPGSSCADVIAQLYSKIH